MALGSRNDPDFLTRNFALGTANSTHLNKFLVSCGFRDWEAYPRPMIMTAYAVFDVFWAKQGITSADIEELINESRSRLNHNH